MVGARQNLSGVVELKGRGEEGKFLTDNVFRRRGEFGEIPTKVFNIHRKLLTEYIAEERMPILENKKKLGDVAMALLEAHASIRTAREKFFVESCKEKLIEIANLGDAIVKLQNAKTPGEKIAALKTMDNALDGLADVFLFNSADSYLADNVKPEVVEIIKELRTKQSLVEGQANAIIPQEIGVLYDHGIGDNPHEFSSLMKLAIGKFTEEQIAIVAHASGIVFNLRELAENFSLD